MNISKRERQIDFSSNNENPRYNETYNNRRTPRKSNGGKIILFIVMFIAFTIIPAIGFGLFSLTSNIVKDLSEPTSFTYFYTDAGDVYYFEGYSSGGYDWWKYDIDTKKWAYYDTYNQKEMMPPGVELDDAYDWAGDLAEVIGVEYEELNVYDSKEYIDAGNHFTPDTSYYYYNDELYYFLDDNHSSYGTTDNSGWYKYNNDTWEFFCKEDDKEILGEDLWYYDDDYQIYSLDNHE